MKEAIKVQSVTVIVINGISEAFEVYIGLYRRRRHPGSYSWLPVGEHRPRAVCGTEGSDKGTQFSRGTPMEN